MNQGNKLRISHLAKKMSDIKIGQRMVIGMMTIITIMGLPIIMLVFASISYQQSYNRTLENLSDISYIIQQTRVQGYRIIDYCTMNMNIKDSGETEIIVDMMECVDRIRGNIGNDPLYEDNQAALTIVDNLLTNYANSYKSGTEKCGQYFNLSGDSDFYSMVDTANYIVNNCNDLLNLEMNRSNDLRKSIQKNFQRIMIIISVFVIIMFILMIGLVYAMTESIIYPLNRLMGHISAVSRTGLIGDEPKEGSRSDTVSIEHGREEKA